MRTFWFLLEKRLQTTHKQKINNLFKLLLDLVVFIYNQTVQYIYSSSATLNSHFETWQFYASCSPFLKWRYTRVMTTVIESMCGGTQVGCVTWVMCITWLCYIAIACNGWFIYKSRLSWQFSLKWIYSKHTSRLHLKLQQTTELFRSVFVCNNNTS